MTPYATPQAAPSAAPAVVDPEQFGDLADLSTAVQWAAARAVAFAATDADDARELLAMLGLDRLRRSAVAA